MEDEPERMNKSDPVDGERRHYGQRANIKVHVGEQDGFGNSK